MVECSLQTKWLWVRVPLQLLMLGMFEELVSIFHMKFNFYWVKKKAFEAFLSSFAETVKIGESGEVS